MLNTTAPAQLISQLNAEQLRDMVMSQCAVVRSQAAQIEARDRELLWRQAKIDKLTFEISQLRRAQYGTRSEQLTSEQTHLFAEEIDADIAAVETGRPSGARPDSCRLTHSARACRILRWTLACSPTPQAYLLLSATLAS